MVAVVAAEAVAAALGCRCYVQNISSSQLIIASFQRRQLEHAKQSTGGKLLGYAEVRVLPELQPELVHIRDDDCGYRRFHHLSDVRWH